MSIPKPTKKSPITRLTTTICTPWLKSTTRPTFPHCRLDRGGRATGRPRRGRRGGAGDEGGGVAGAELGEGADLPGDPRHQEDDPHQGEQGHGDGQERAVEVGCHLPDLGGEEQEDHEQQEQGQGPHEQPEEIAELVPEPTGRPPGHGHQAVAGGDVDHAEQGQVAGGGVEGGEPLASGGQRESGRGEDEDPQLRRADPVGALQQPLVAQGVGAGPHRDERSEPAGGDADVHPPRPREVQGADQLEQDDQGQDGQRAGEDVPGGAVVLDEVRDAAGEKPSLDVPHVLSVGDLGVGGHGA